MNNLSPAANVAVSATPFPRSFMKVLNSTILRAKASFEVLVFIPALVSYPFNLLLIHKKTFPWHFMNLWLRNPAENL